MVKHSGRIPLGCILTAVVLEVADVFLFLGIDRNYRQPLFHEGLCLGIDVLKLRIPVHMGLSHLQGLLVELQAVAHTLKKFPDLDMTYPEPLVLKLCLKVPQTLCSPA